MNKKQKVYTALFFTPLVVGIAVVIVAWSAGGTQAAPAVEPRGIIIDYGITSLAPGQTARLNVVNIGNPNDIRARFTVEFDIYGTAPPEPDVPPCDGSAVFCMNNLRLLRRETAEVRLRPGEATSFTFTPRNGETFMAPCIRTGPETRLAPTLEIREAARTIFVPPIGFYGVDPSNPN
ncbi:MAG TPA: hypothetical protein VNA17_03575 [Pyrinomonadaceae bacterium]|nr:hypothetical protein [Pyrinomonadaceae bacterium]